MITVKQHGKQGYHVNRFGLQKPVLMWAEEGTKVRYVRKGGGQVAQTADGKWRTLGRRRGQMPAYHFLDGVEAKGAPIVERDIGTIPTYEILPDEAESTRHCQQQQPVFAGRCAPPWDWPSPRFPGDALCFPVQHHQPFPPMQSTLPQYP